MNTQIPFIDREEELARIDKMIVEWGKRYIICVNGHGGIGKTRLLQEVRRRYTTGDDAESLLLVPDIIDFDDRVNHISQNLGRKLAQMLDEKAFELYQRRLLDYRKMEMAGISSERLTQELEMIDQIFVGCFNEVAKKRRIVLLLDTVDAIVGKDVWNYLVRLGLYLSNTVLLIAGRNADKVWESLFSQLGSDVQCIDLPPLKEEASEEYLLKKQEMLRITLEKELAEKVLLLAQGRPILIDLAVEWRARHIPLEWLVESSLEELKTLSDDARKKRQEEFEYQLVRHIADTHRLIDWVILLMSRVYPLDMEMIRDLLRVPKDKADELFEQAQGYAFVKTLPDKRISLHDEMRRMVNDHVWPEVDRDGDRRRSDSKLVVEYLEGEIDTLKNRVSQLETKEKDSYDNDSEQALISFIEREKLERDLWVLEGQRLDHILFIDLNEGIKLFATLFDEATKTYRFSFRESLIAQIQQFTKQLSPEQLYVLNSRRVKYLLDDSQYSQAKELATEIIASETILPVQQVDMLIQHGNIVIRLGHLDEGVSDFERAVDISKQYNLREWFAPALNALGWGHRLEGHYDKAKKYYQEALQYSIREGDKLRQAWILNNLAFVYGQQARYSTALALCEQASKLWHEIGNTRGLGALYEAYGVINTVQGLFDDSLSYYKLALDIFEPNDDREWLSKVYAGRGLTYRLSGNLDAAEKELNRALEIDLKRDRPMILHRMAHVYLERGDIEKANSLFQQSYQDSLDSSDGDHELNNLGDMAGIAVSNQKYEQLDEFVERYHHYKQRWPDLDYPRIEGMLLKHLGDLAVGLTPDNISQACKYYQDAFPLLAKYETYKAYTVQSQLAALEYHLGILSVPRQARVALGKLLYETWKEKDLSEDHPEGLSFFMLWMEEGDQNA